VLFRSQTFNQFGLPSGPPAGSFGPQYGQQTGQFGQPMSQYGQQMGQPWQAPGQFGQQMGYGGQQMGQYGQPNGPYGQQNGQFGQPMGQFGQPMGQPWQPTSQQWQPMGQYGQPQGPYGQPMGPMFPDIGPQGFGVNGQPMRGPMMQGPMATGLPQLQQQFGPPQGYTGGPWDPTQAGSQYNHGNPPSNSNTNPAENQMLTDNDKVNGTDPSPSSETSAKLVPEPPQRPSSKSSLSRGGNRNKTDKEKDSSTKKDELSSPSKPVASEEPKDSLVCESRFVDARAPPVDNLFDNHLSRMYEYTDPDLFLGEDSMMMQLDPRLNSSLGYGIKDNEEDSQKPPSVKGRRSRLRTVGVSSMVPLDNIDDDFDIEALFTSSSVESQKSPNDKIKSGSVPPF